MALNPDALHKPVRRLRKLLKRLPKRPVPGDVHDLRTSARRLEAALTALSMRPKRALDGVSRVRRAAGKVRDMDVLIHFASMVHPEGEDDCSVQLLEHLGAQRRKHAKRLHAVVDKYKGSARKSLKKTGHDFDTVELGGPKAAATAIGLEHELMQQRLGRQSMHTYRLKVKQLRNTLRLAQAGDGEMLDALGDVKDSIGEWHDWEELLTVAKDALDHGPKCGLLRTLKRTCDEKYGSALRKARALQRVKLKDNHEAAARLA
jgi:CHAD domain-containing protein